MTGTECFRAALNILSETPDSGVYYEQFALGALNQLLANSLREMNAERASDGKDVLLVPPRMTALTEELPTATGWRANVFRTGWRRCLSRMTTRPSLTGRQPSTANAC